MDISFEKHDKVSVFLNPFTNFERSETKCQLRRDPLTHRTGRLAHFVGFKPPAADFAAIIENSRKNCPFCPENVFKMTPEFDHDHIAEGRLEQGQSVLFPNLLPYDAHSALAVICKDHFKTLSEFSPRLLWDAFLNCRKYLDRVVENKTRTYGLVTWNYMPAAGSSQVHPHFQVYATDYPGNFLTQLLAASMKYMEDNNRAYWQDYLEAEIQNDQRVIAQKKSSTWLTDFVSLSPLTDVIAIFPDKQTLFDLNEDELFEAASMMNEILNWMGHQGVYSLNAAWMPAVEKRTDHWLQLRISPRLYLAPHVWCTDTPSLVSQYQESFMIRSPEEVAGEIKNFINYSSNASA
jgi:galactose-1-phosphate uridylyltransferase